VNTEQCRALEHARQIIAGAVAEGLSFHEAAQRLRAEPGLQEALREAPPIFRSVCRRSREMSKDAHAILAPEEATLIIEKALQLLAQEGCSFASATEQVEREYRRLRRPAGGKSRSDIRLIRLALEKARLSLEWANGCFLTDRPDLLRSVDEKTPLDDILWKGIQKDELALIEQALKTLDQLGWRQ